MKWLRQHPAEVTAFAFALAAVTAVAIALAYGAGAFGNAWSHLHPAWLLLTIVGEALVLPTYALPYRALARYQGGPNLSLPLVARAVAAGFGPLAAAGGFALDKRALYAIEGDEDAAVLRVLGLGALEWSLLAPVAWVSAIVLLAVGDHRVMSSLLWPWVVLVPLGTAVAFWLAQAQRRERMRSRGGWRKRAEPGLRAISLLPDLGRELRTCWHAWLGMTLYWLVDIAAFYGAARFIGLHENLGEIVLAYATGYALTRRSMPLGGAGVTEALMTFALHWVGQPVPAALAVVVVYRVFNFLVPGFFALLVRPHLGPLLQGS